MWINSKKLILNFFLKFRVVERGRTKCAQYWGPEPGDDVSAGGFTVTTLDVDTNPDYTISKLLLANNKVYRLISLVEFKNNMFLLI